MVLVNVTSYAIKLAEMLGNTLREPHSKALGDGLFELRRNHVRLFYMFEPSPGRSSGSLAAW